VTAEGTRLEAVWAIRDARDLDTDQKAFLWAVESRGVATAHWRTMADDVDMTRSRFYRSRREAIEAGLVEQVEHRGRNGLRVVFPALALHVPPEALAKYARTACA
jgi:hypothetical protein